MLMPVMGLDDRYRAEAQRCLELAESAPNSRIARRWRDLADDYIALAERVDTPPPVRWQMQQQSRLE
jgi:hypothetical protein